MYVYEYQHIRQVMNMSLSEYRIAFDQSIADLEVLSCPQVRSEDFRARHFIARLDTDRYREFKLHCLNSSRSGGPIPNTIQKAFDAAKVFMPIIRVNQNKVVTPMIYSTQFKGSCYKCGKPGHKADVCRSKTDDDQASKANSANEIKSTDQEQRSDGDTKPSGNKKSSKQKKNKGSGGNSNKTAYATDLSDSGYADVYGFTTEICINVAESNCNPHQNDRAVSLDCLANHSFGFCKSIMSDLRKHNFTVTGVNGKSKGTLIGNIPCFGPVAYTPQSNKNGIALWEVETEQNHIR
jgi:hypothetical protein